MDTSIKNKKSFVRRVLFLLAMPVPAFAATKVAELIGNLCDWLSGEIGVAIGIAVVIWTGYEVMGGNINVASIVKRVIGVGLIIGGSYIGSSILHIG